MWSAPLEDLTVEQWASFESIDQGARWPEVGSRMMTRVMTGRDMCDGWVIVQDGIYRYGVAQAAGMLVPSMLVEYLATGVRCSE